MFGQVSMIKRKQLLYLKAAGFSLFLLFLFWSAYLRLPSSEHYATRYSLPNSGRSVVREMFQANPGQAEECLIPHLKHRLLPDNRSASHVACRRLKPLKNSCQVSKRLFQLKSKTNQGCLQDGLKAVEFCKIQKDGHVHRISCNITTCKTDLLLGSLVTRTGTYKWKTAENSSALERAIQALMSQNTSFCLVKCRKTASGHHVDSKDYVLDNQDDGGLGYQYQYDNGLDLSPPQILNLPPHQGSVIRKKEERSKKVINFNIIFIDSVSKHHLFRSLPKTVKLIEGMLQQYSKSNFSNRLPMILDFDLVQAIRSRTYESLQALFAGLVNPFEKPFSTLGMPPTPLKTETLLKPLKKLGYTTLWLEDLCYLWEWGISKDLLVHNKSLSGEDTWKNLQKALKRAGIDSLGNTYAHCEILDYNGVNDHFHGPDKVCYNGKHQHQYSLEYLKLYQDTMHSIGQPYFTFFQTNIGHEDTGVRIQDFDEDFVHYLKPLISQENTLTIIFSDHGNAYGKFMEKSQEARIELFHPFLLMTLPQGVQKVLDGHSLDNIVINQERLISLLDLHYTLTYLIRTCADSERQHIVRKYNHLFQVSDFNKQFRVTSKGLFGRISESRTCSEMPRISPNLCICEGFEIPVSYGPYYFILALYALGELNNHILKQRRAGQGRQFKDDGGFGNCERLVVQRVENIRESRNKDDSKTVKMDIHTQSSVKTKSEVFFVTIEIPLHHHKQIQLNKFERISAYSQFSQCSDPGVDLPLCVCDLKMNSHLKLKPQRNPFIYSNTTVEKSSVEIHGEKCLHIVVQYLEEGGVIFETHNSCKHDLSATFMFETSNLILSADKTISTDIFTNDLIFLLAGVIENENKDWTWSVKTEVQSVQVS